jgi:hypothetical protein
MHAVTNAMSREAELEPLVRRSKLLFGNIFVEAHLCRANRSPPAFVIQAGHSNLDSLPIKFNIVVSGAESKDFDRRARGQPPGEGKATGQQLPKPLSMNLYVANEKR